jgi:hypothetical protein
MRTIYKYGLTVGHETELRLPAQAEFRHAASQHRLDIDIVSLWFEVNPDHLLVSRRFIATGTGMPIEHNWEYRATALAAEGRLVWHVFETTP